MINLQAFQPPFQFSDAYLIKLRLFNYDISDTFKKKFIGSHS